MNNELELFFRENIDTIIELNNQLKNYNKQIESKRNNVLEALKDKFPEELIEKYCRNKSNPIKPYSSDSDIYTCVYIDFNINKIVFEPYLDYNGWHISVWKRTSSSSTSYVNSIRNYFITKGIEVSDQPRDEARKRKVVLRELPGDADTEEISDSIIDVMVTYIVPYLESIK